VRRIGLFVGVLALAWMTPRAASAQDFGDVYLQSLMDGVQIAGPVATGLNAANMLAYDDGGLDALRPELRVSATASGLSALVGLSRVGFSGAAYSGLSQTRTSRDEYLWRGAALLTFSGIDAGIASLQLTGGFVLYEPALGVAPLNPRRLVHPTAMLAVGQWTHGLVAGISALVELGAALAVWAHAPDASWSLFGRNGRLPLRLRVLPTGEGVVVLGTF